MLCQLQHYIVEAYTEHPEVVKGAPYRAALSSRIDEKGLTTWEKFATTWRAYLKFVAKKEV